MTGREHSLSDTLPTYAAVDAGAMADGSAEIPERPARDTDEILAELARQGIVRVQFLDFFTRETRRTVLIPYSSNYHTFFERVKKRFNNKDESLFYFMLPKTGILLQEDMWQIVGPMQDINAAIGKTTDDLKSFKRLPGCNCAQSVAENRFAVKPKFSVLWPW